MKKGKLSVAVVVSTAAIASGIVLSSVNSAEACGYYKKRFQPMTWLNSPWAIAIVLPGVALATALYMGGRSYKNEWE